MFDRMREAHETEGAAYDNGAEAMSETLEIIRKNEVHARLLTTLNHVNLRLLQTHSTVASKPAHTRTAATLLAALPTPAACLEDAAELEPLSDMRCRCRCRGRYARCW